MQKSLKQREKLTLLLFQKDLAILTHKKATAGIFASDKPNQIANSEPRHIQ